MSDLISDALIEKLAEYGINPPQSYKDLSDLIDSHYDWLLEQTVLTDEILKPISEGQKADHVTLLRLALALEMSEDEVRELNEKQRIQGNGVTQEKKRSPAK